MSRMSQSGSEEIAANAHYIGTPYRAYLLSIIKPCGRNSSAELGPHKVRSDFDADLPKRHPEIAPQLHSGSAAPPHSGAEMRYQKYADQQECAERKQYVRMSTLLNSSLY